MSEGLPEPLVSAEVDLRGLEWMPLLGDRLFGSATWIAASAEAKVAALRLWWRAYAHEVPAASLPDDDALLADYAGYGVAVKAWRKLREQALRGWVKCSDGRLYHPVVSELVREAWEQRKRAREKQARYRNRNRPHAGDVTVTQPSCNGASAGDVTPDLDLTGPDQIRPIQPSPLPVPEDARGGGGEGRDEGVGDAPNPVARFRQRWDGSAGGYAGDDRSAPGKVAAAIAERERQRQERGE